MTTSRGRFSLRRRPRADETAESAAPPPDQGRVRRWLRRGAPIVGALVVGVLAIIGLVSLFSGGDDDTADGPRAPSTADGGDTDGGGGEAGSGAVPIVPTTGFGIIDLFQRTDDELGLAPNGATWLEIEGDWRVDAGIASIETPAPEGSSIAAINLGTTDAMFQLTMPRVVPGAGVVFRVQNTFNYWAVQAAPSAGTWSVRRVTNGQTIEVATLGPAFVDDGTTIGVRTRGNRMTFYVNGVRVLDLEDPTLARSTRVGMIAFGEATTEAQWANFVALGESPSQFPVEPDASDAEQLELELEIPDDADDGARDEPGDDATDDADGEGNRGDDGSGDDEQTEEETSDEEDASDEPAEDEPADDAADEESSDDENADEENTDEESTDDARAEEDEAGEEESAGRPSVSVDLSGAFDDVEDDAT